MAKYETKSGYTWRSVYPIMLHESKHSQWIQIKQSILDYQRGNRELMIQAIDDQPVLDRHTTINIVAELGGAWTWHIPATEYHDWKANLLRPSTGIETAEEMDRLLTYFTDLDKIFTRHEESTQIQDGIHNILLLVTSRCDKMVWDVQTSSAYAITWYFEWGYHGLGTRAKDAMKSKMLRLFSTLFSSYHVRDLADIREAEESLAINVLEARFDLAYPSETFIPETSSEASEESEDETYVLPPFVEKNWESPSEDPS
eukprot:TRINITY_DN5169_c0_g1_i4.p1 TRINITY_DN5169_c0_g1~~TRINITY_DN5169_c0_g1_i4.p1  ORF type:complete len:257 (-),score=60.61 TRINITY_DN5169_c0_g1_i4:21-791(-)